MLTFRISSLGATLGRFMGSVLESSGSAGHQKLLLPPSSRAHSSIFPVSLFIGIYFLKDDICKKS